MIVSAHVDAPLTGAAYNDWALRAWAGFARIWPARTTPAVGDLLGDRAAAAAARRPHGRRRRQWISALQLPQTFVLLIAAFFLGEIALSPSSPGGNDDAAGVAAALAVAERLREQPPESLEVVLLLAGAGETTRQGARAFIRSHRKQLPKDRTWFIDIDSPGPRRRALRRRRDPGRRPARQSRARRALRGALRRRVRSRRAALGPATSASLAGAHGYPAIALTARETDGFVPRDHHTPDDTADASSPRRSSASPRLRSI